jgi:hypothetical protein
MTGLRRSILACVCAIGVTAAVAATASAAPRAAHTNQTGTWRIAATIRPAKGSRVFLSSVSAPGAGDVWALGGTLTNSNQSFPVLEHWNGSSWQQVTVPGAGYPFYPYQVAASSAADVWVFGLAQGVAVPRWAHWNGRSWTTGALPVITVAGNSSPAVTITAAAAAGPGDVWVAGTVTDWNSKFGLPAQAFLANDDGHGWQTYRIPVGMPNLVGISALSRTDIWAAATGGQGTSGVGEVTTNKAVLMHWNGASWQSIPVPRNVNVSAVAGISAHSAWVTGSLPGKGPDGLNFVAGAAYWNGARWTTTTDPAADAQSPQDGTVNQLTSVTSDGRGGLWAVAEPYPPVVGSLPGQASLWHYSNGRWTGVQLGKLGYINLFQIAEAPGSTSIWAAGTTVTTASPGYPQNAIILRYGD